MAVREDTQMMIEKLQNGICEVFFKKVEDGSVRQMLCTLNADKVPIFEGKRIETAGMSQNPSVIAVWDIEKSAWRSFRVQSVLMFNERSDMRDITETTQLENL
jgi:hypothetical protein